MKNYSPETGVTNTTVDLPPNGGGGGGLLSKGGWLERNGALAGNIISGIGQGMMASGQADAEIAGLREKQKIIDRNYEGVNPSAGFTPMARTRSGQRPNERFDPDHYASYEYQYNPQTGRIERVAV